MVRVSTLGYNYSQAMLCNYWKFASDVYTARITIELRNICPLGACAYTHANTNAHTHAYTHIHTYIHTHTHIYTHRRTHAHADAHAHAHAHTRTIKIYDAVIMTDRK